MSLLSGIPGIQASPTGVPSLFNSMGIPLGKLPLQLLTIFPPTGYLGLNLTAAGLPITSAIKAATYGLGIIIGIYANGLYMNQVASFLSYILIFAPPWYIFDCIQIITDTKFNENGFLLPLPVPMIPSGGGKEGKWILTFPLLSLILAATSFSGIAFLSKFVPSSLTGTIGPYIQYGIIILGALFSIAAAFGVYRQIPVGVEPSIPGLTGGLPAIPTDLSSLTSILPKMAGGGNNNSKLPPLSSFIKNLKPQEGGSKESIPFIGVLGLIILGGFSLSYLRSKQE